MRTGDIFESDTRDETEQIIEQYGLSKSLIVEKRIDKILKTELFIAKRIMSIAHNFIPTVKNDIAISESEILSKIRNTNVFENGLLEYEKFPSGLKTLGVFLLCYKKPCSCSHLGVVSDQPAATIRTLADKYHCVWDMGGYKNATIKINGATCRRIVGIDYNAETDYGNYIKVSKDVLKDLIKHKRCPVTGKRGQRAKFQIDHRIPVAACKEQGRIPAVLTQDMIEDGSWKKDFQILSQQTNQDKQGACSHCRLAGGQIWVPPHIEDKQSRGQYIDRYIHDCKKCFWYDCEKGNR